MNKTTAIGATAVGIVSIMAVFLMSDFTVIDTSYSWNVSGNITYNIASLDPSNAYHNDTLNCSVYINYTEYIDFTNVTSANFTVYYTFFKNGVIQNTYSNYMYYSGITNNTKTLSFSNKTITGITKGDRWSCRIKYYMTTDTSKQSPVLVSNEVTVNNTIPAVTLVRPSYGEEVDISNDYYPTLKWSVADQDNETITSKVYGRDSCINIEDCVQEFATYSSCGN